MSKGHAAATKQKPAARSGPPRPRAAQKKTEEKGMASKSAVLTKAKAKEQEAPADKDKETPETPDSPLPLLDLSDAAVKKMIKQAKKRAYVTHEQLTAVLPSEEVSSDQIEDIYAMLNEMGINVVEQEENADEEEKAQEEAAEDDDDGDGELVEAKPKPLVTTSGKEPAERTDDPVRMYLREMGSVELLSRDGEIVRGGAVCPRGRDRHRQAHRGRPRGDDRRPVREPAVVPGHHHLARRAQRGKGVPAGHHRPRSALCRPRRKGHAGPGRARRPADPAAGRRGSGPRGTGGHPRASAPARERPSVQAGVRACQRRGSRGRRDAAE